MHWIWKPNQFGKIILWAFNERTYATWNMTFNATTHSHTQVASNGQRRWWNFQKTVVRRSVKALCVLLSDRLLLCVRSRCYFRKMKKKIMTIMTHFEKKDGGTWNVFFFFLKMRWQLNRFFPHIITFHDDSQFYRFKRNIHCCEYRKKNYSTSSDFLLIQFKNLIWKKLCVLTTGSAGLGCLNVVLVTSGGTTAKWLHCSGSCPAWIAFVANPFGCCLNPDIV